MSSDEHFKRMEDSLQRLKNIKVDVFGGPAAKPRPCEEEPPRFTDQDCKECPDRICEKLPAKGGKD